MALRIVTWWKDEDAATAIEAGLIFPILMTIMCGTIDIGIAIITNQKLLNASQMVSDLLTREERLEPDDIQEAFVAGQLSMQPYNTDTFGVDVAGVQFLTESLTPTVQWREIINTSANEGVEEGSAGLGLENEGVIAVTARYSYEPFFTYVFTTAWNMEEVSYARPRNGLFIDLEE